VALQTDPEAVLSEDDYAPGHGEPDGGYGWAKLLGEIQLGWMPQVATGIARIFNVYGECADLGPNAQVVPSLILKAPARLSRGQLLITGDFLLTRTPAEKMKNEAKEGVANGA